MEPTVIYIDVLFALNLFVNYFLLLAAGLILRRPFKRWRLLVSALLGALFALTVLLPDGPAVLTALSKLLMFAVLVLTAFGFVSPLSMIKAFGAFLAVNVAFGGIMFALYYFVAPAGMLYYNGTVYFNISPLILIGMTILCYAIVRLLGRILKHEGLETGLYTVILEADGITAQCTALLDTGNSLTDVLSGMPVMVVEYGAVEPLLPQKLRPVFRDASTRPELAASIDDPAWAKRFRLIPFDSLGAGGMLPAFKPDSIQLRRQGAAGKQKNANSVDLAVQGGVLVAVTSRRLSAGEYCALLSTQMIRI